MESLGRSILSIELGKVVVEGTVEEQERHRISRKLEEEGFQLIHDRKGRIINQIKSLIIEFIHHGLEKPRHMNLSDFLASEVGHDYSYLSSLFSSVEGTTIEKYMIRQKIEKVKELLAYDELSLSEIAVRLDYSSVQHLSSQFRKTTGLTPSHFRKIGNQKRKPLDQL